METNVEWKMILLVISTFLSSVSSNQIDCYLDNQECRIEANNLVNTYMHISTIEECTGLCQEDNTCTAFTHFGQDSHPFPQACLLFSSCSQRMSCQDCVTGSNQADCTCSLKYSGEVNDDNFVEMVGSVTDESACKKLCIKSDKCVIYTFYNGEDPVNPNVCILLTSAGLQMPVTLCDHCVTGPGRCELGQRCQVAVITNGTATQAILAEESMVLNVMATEKDCYTDLTALAIGGGGGNSNSGCGGGSGYLETGTIRVRKHSKVELKVGGPGQNSTVEIGGEALLVASTGGDGGSRKCGDGYSGGGGSSNGRQCGRGGTNGGDGQEGTTKTKEPGKGSGLDLGKVTMENFILTPGEGGAGVYYEIFGGGGGGVLVNGKSPGVDQYKGQGFGGGGNYKYQGYSGCVLIEL
eukprot:GFUD01011445.1.p1 GENE.GFUD01011445.1~~GFUD01011445.1.p1  ORF type:complete len:425 (+),score=118.58 GFUD01011445.1:49-1275(+)